MYLFLKADATVSVFMIILYTYPVSLTLFLCISLHVLAYICILPGVMCYISALTGYKIKKALYK